MSVKANLFDEDQEGTVLKHQRAAAHSHGFMMFVQFLNSLQLVQFVGGEKFYSSNRFQWFGITLSLVRAQINFQHP